MIRIILGLSIALMVSLPGRSQSTTEDPAFYWVSFTDKDSTRYAVDRPEEFLSPRAVQRRRLHGVEISETDFPVNSWYLDSLRMQGAGIHHTSRWFNAATVLATSAQVATIQERTFVDSVIYVGRYIPKRTAKSGHNSLLAIDSFTVDTLADLPLGYATFQMSLLRGDSLRQMGFTGKGKMIGVLDGGFNNVRELPFFKRLHERGGLLFTHDLVEGDSFVYESSTHGTQVLSLMAADIPHLLVGTATGADYLCLKTEDTRWEHRFEECNWIAGLELADSAGVDIINSSLGYTTFNDESMNYEYAQLDGQTALASRAADLAFDRGIIVVVSAGNEGNSSWRHLSVPADARGALAIGAVDLQGQHASFSSVGPAADGRIKPDLSAPGQFVAVASPDSFQVMVGSGTSFAAPIISGLVASLWEAFPEARHHQIIDALRQSASRADRPDDKLGYGIPDFSKAFRILQERKEQ